jgi:CRP-like cAMP-binding protein
MPLPQQVISPTKNRLLATLPKEEYERLRPRFEPVHLAKGKIICGTGETVRHAYFIMSGMISMLSSTEGGSMVEIAMIGSEGMTGTTTVLHAERSPYDIIVQIRGEAVRVASHFLRERSDKSPVLQDTLLRYAHALLTQVSRSAACNRFHTAEERLCRWLLVTRDRVGSDSFDLTQEFLSYMLGVPRTSVTAVANSLQRAGIVRYTRGRIAVIDVRGLEDMSCECYRVLKKSSDQFLAA